MSIIQKINILFITLFAALQAEAQTDHESIFYMKALEMSKAIFGASGTRSMNNDVIKKRDMAYGKLFSVVDASSRQERGFILISNDESNPRLVAFGEETTFAEASMPEHIKSWLEQYAISASYYPEECERMLAASNTRAKDVEPLLSNIQWGQDNPYSLKCPVIDGEYAPTGCVATAVSQIMKYHQWPEKGEGEKSYVTDTHKLPLSCSFSDLTIQWDKIQDSYAPVITSTSTAVTVLHYGNVRVDQLQVVNDRQNVYVGIGYMRMADVSSFNGKMAFMIFNQKNELVGWASEPYTINSINSSLLVYNQAFAISVPRTIPDGEYSIKCGVCPADSRVWTIASASASSSNSINIEKKGGNFNVGSSEYSCSLSAEDAEPVSELLSAVGIAVNMNYTLAGSGAFDSNVLTGLTNHFRYDADMAMLNSDAFDVDTWHQVLQTELAEKRPVYYSGISKGANVGHAFVIDGMKKVDEAMYYHVNWGWDGLCDGYYLLNALTPSDTGTGATAGDNFSYYNTMIVGIKPENGITELRLLCGGLDVYTKNVYPGQVISTYINSLVPMSSVDMGGTLMAELIDHEGKTVGVAYEEKDVYLYHDRPWKDYAIRCVIPSDISGGEYSMQLSFVSEDGVRYSAENRDWPLISVADKSEWAYGINVSPDQRLAAAGIHLYGEQGYSEDYIILQMDSILNLNPEVSFGALSLAVCDTNGKVISSIGNTTDVAVGNFMPLLNVPIRAQLSQYMPNGDYLLSLLFTPEGERQRTFVYRMMYEGNIDWSGFDILFFPFSVTDGVCVFDGFSVRGTDILWMEETGIDAVDAVNNECSVFSASGVRIMHDGNVEKAVPTLPAGIYYVKNKQGTRKIIVK